MSIETKSSETKKHDRFKLHMELNSQPIDIDIEADNTEETVSDKTRNPNKFSFGRIPFTNGNLEGYTYKNTRNYPLFLIFHGSQNLLLKKGLFFQIDIRRLNEVLALITKMKYFRGLTLERKKNYLRFHSDFANHMVRSNTNAAN